MFSLGIIVLGLLVITSSATMVKYSHHVRE